VHKDSRNLEREFKFAMPPDEEVVLSLVRPLLRRSWLLVKWPPCTELDLYFDAVELPLFRSGDTFRLRKRHMNPGWTANFKSAPKPELGYMERRDARTSVTTDQALLFATTGIPGLAASLAESALHLATQDRLSNERGCHLRPVVQIASCHRCFTVRPGGFEDRASNFLNITFEHVTAIDVRNADATALIRSGFINYSRPVPSTTFSIAELEVDGRSEGMEEESLEMMVGLSRRIVGAGLTPVTISKYRQAIVRLQLGEIDNDYRADVGQANAHGGAEAVHTL
jgi:hypothetical protein